MSAYLPNNSPAPSQLRNMLAAHFHGKAPAAPLGYQSWAPRQGMSDCSFPKPLLVGEAVALLVSPAPRTCPHGYH